MKSRLLFVLSVAGLTLSAYLLSAYQSATPIGCVDEGCQRVRDSPYSSLYGVPVPLLGVLFYGTVALLQLSRAWLPRLVRPIDGATLGLSAAGVLFSAWLTYLEVAVIHALCTWCVLSALLTLGLGVLSALLWRRPEPVDPEEPALWSVRGHVGWGAAAVFLLMVAIYAVDTVASPPAAQERDEQVVYPSSLLYREGAHFVGRERAPLHLVVFSDSMCGVCADLIPIVVAYVKQQPQLRLTFRHFPLRGHEWSIPAAEAEEAAGEQGKFWEFQELLLTKQSEAWTPKDFPRYARQLGLDVKRFEEALRTRRFRDRVLEDRREGERMGVRTTPVFFLNNRRLYMELTPDSVLGTLRDHIIEYQTRNQPRKSS